MMGRMSYKLESRLLWEITTSYIQMNHPDSRRQRWTKEPIDEGEKGDWKPGLKPRNQKTKIMVTCSITSWQIQGEKMEAVADFLFLSSKITKDSDCHHKIKRCLLLGRKAMTNIDSILKSRDITLSTKVPLVKAMVFPVVMNRCESWTIKKAECRRTDAFELCCCEDSWESLQSQGNPTSPS